ncbi:helix-turn-helix domain-containing protein [Paracoccus sp. Ld10]|uniref:helix-turn-helix domain-containing protein n=1 Tax=Paracoccus sp. Ld10 TaxID=649158 RepID=UPI0038706213
MLPSFDTATDLRETIRNTARQRRIALGLTQIELSQRSGVPLGTLKRFERLGEISLASLLALAEAMEALEAFHDLFPLPEARTLDDIERQAKPPVRVRARSRR